jgi:hypothetical protein
MEPTNQEVMDELRKLRLEQENMFVSILAASIRGNFPGMSNDDIKRVAMGALHECRVR